MPLESVMASLEKDDESGFFRARFRFRGKSYKRSLKTRDPRAARSAIARIDETIRLIECGRFIVPKDANVAAFIMSDGKLTGKETNQADQIQALGELLDTYRENIPAGAKEQSTLDCEDIHIRHLKRHFGVNKRLGDLRVQDIQAYLNKRLKKQHRGRPIKPQTVRKELQTLSFIWTWATEQELISLESPVRKIKYPKADEQLAFMTADQIRATIEGTELTKEERQDLWGLLYLRLSEIDEILVLVKKRARQEFIYPMLLFAAHTGVRRSEILRSQRSDFDFSTQLVRIREKKRSRKNAISFRHVPMSPLLSSTMHEWLHHNNSPTVFSWPTGEGLTRDEAHRHFKTTLRKTTWSDVRGFHVFRHSFASNLACNGIDQRLIDEWMGHQTEEMRRRYRHLFPDQQRQAIDLVFGSSSKKSA